MSMQVGQHSVIGFIGTGVMGRSMAANLMKAGFGLVVSTRTKSRATPLLEAGAEWRDGPGEVAAAADVVITMLGYPKDVQEVYFGADGILERARPGTYLVDMTTSEPALARRIAVEARQRGLRAMDAPVSGGDIGAREGRLAIMCGGCESDFAALQPLLRALGQNIVLQGPPGAGQHTKMCNQIAVAVGMIGMTEALAYAAEAGLDGAKVLSSIGGGAAGSWALTNLAPRVLRGDFEPGFYIRHMVKDLRIAREMAADMAMHLPGLDLAAEIYEHLEQVGLGSRGTQAIYQYYQPPEA
jgi:3-hydroxyisobutyrate dehydrogenase